MIKESGSNRRMERNYLYVVLQLYFTPVIIAIIRTRFIGYAGMGRNYNVVKISVGKLKEKTN